jgi:hypothetical protein
VIHTPHHGKTDKICHPDKEETDFHASGVAPADGQCQAYARYITDAWNRNEIMLVCNLDPAHEPGRMMHWDKRLGVIWAHCEAGDLS